MASYEGTDIGVALTDEAIAKQKSRLGMEIRLPQPPNEVATKDNIRNWAWGIGDANPLWLDEEYAKKTRWGCIIAPPTFLCTFGEGDPSSIGFAGLHFLWLEDLWEFYRPVALNDRVTVTAKFIKLEERPSKLAKRAVDQVAQSIFRNQAGEAMAKYERTVRAYERMAAKSQEKYSGWTRHHYTEDEIKAIEEDCLGEERRGANPRYIEDVSVGDGLGHVVKGPLTITDIIAFHRGRPPVPFAKAHRFSLDQRRRHPRIAVKDPYGVPDVIERVHWDNDFAKEVGVPSAFDYGWQRIAWCVHLLTNWMSDDGFLKKLRVQLRLPNLIGDTTWMRGKVTGKYTENTEHLVECEFWGDNQRKERNTVGWATITLPSRSRLAN